MALRCLLFTSDEGTVQSVCQALADLGVDSEHCALAVEAVQKVTNNAIHLLIIDWDNQTEAAFLLKTARERKASERPLTVAIVSRELNVTQALQAGANSVLKRPLVPIQVRDSLSSARDLLRARHESAGASVTQNLSATAVDSAREPSEKILRAGEFLQSTTAPGAQFITESDVQNNSQETIEKAAAGDLDPLKDLEPVAAAVDTKPAAPEAPDPNEPRGLSWFLKARGVVPSAPPRPAAPKNDLLGYDQMTSAGAAPAQATEGARVSAVLNSQPGQANETTNVEYSRESSPESTKPPGQAKIRRLIFAGALIAVCAIAFVAVPQARWRQNLQVLASNAVHFAHSWLNPQTATPATVPATHENFGLAGDEYKLPVVPNIPDATTDPSQIRVVPVVDPTAKQPPGSTDASQPLDTAPKDEPAQNPADQSDPAAQPQDNVSAQPGSASATKDSPSPAVAPPPAEIAAKPPAYESAPPPTTPVRRDPMQAVSAPSPRPAPGTKPEKASDGIPSSLKSHMAPLTPDPVANKSGEISLPSIEPVDLPESTARGLLLPHAEPAYPESARGQHGTVVLQVLIGRDGTVQDAKFLQGSLAFARTAIDAVKQWQFKPYTMNNRPVSTKTLLTLSFRPAS